MLLVSHYVNIADFTGQTTASGEILVTRRGGDGTLVVTGRFVIAPLTPAQNFGRRLRRQRRQSGCRSRRHVGDHPSAGEIVQKHVVAVGIEPLGCPRPPGQISHHLADGRPRDNLIPGAQQQKKRRIQPARRRRRMPPDRVRA